MKALVVVNCFPPLLKNAGGVSKRYLTLCRALIEGLGWQVTLLTPVNVRNSKEPDVARWLHDGSLVHLPARGVRIESKYDGVAVFLDLMSGINAHLILRELCYNRDYDCVFTDDLVWRFEFLLLTRAMGVPTVTSTHTDITHMPSCKGVVKLVWNLHMQSSHLACVHATVSKVFGLQMSRKYNLPVNAVWPPILWSPEFQSDPATWAEAAAVQRKSWLAQLEKQGCRSPKAILLSAGRWSTEKRIHLLIDAVPDDCALVIVGDGTSEYADKVCQSGSAAGRCNVLPLRKMLNARELRLAYATSDLFLSASNFETLGNTVIEAFCSGTPVAVQPAQGHLEYVTDNQNSWFVDYENTVEAKASLTRIVSAGLDAETLQRVLPELAPLGEKLRTANFAQDFDQAVVQKALTIGNQRSFASGNAGILELVKRICCFNACVFFWLLLRLFSRLVFVTSKDPKFAVLGELGGANEDTKFGTVFTYPCLRVFFGPSNQSTESDSTHQAPLSPKDVSDYDSHFKPALQRTMAKWFKTTHEVVLMTILLLFLGSVFVLPLFR